MDKIKALLLAKWATKTGKIVIIGIGAVVVFVAYKLLNKGKNNHGRKK